MRQSQIRIERGGIDLVQHGNAFRLDTGHEQPKLRQFDGLGERGFVDDRHFIIETAAVLPQRKTLNGFGGVAHRYMGALDKSIADLQRVISADPNMVPGHTNMARTLEQKGELQAARNSLKTVERIGTAGDKEAVKTRIAELDRKMNS